MTFKIDTRGIGELAYEAEAESFIRDIGRASVDAVKDLAPVDTGKLRDSVGYKLERGTDGWVVHVYFDKFYGLFKEFGTATQAAVPFLRPGVLRVISGHGGRLGDER